MSQKTKTPSCGNSSGPTSTKHRYLEMNKEIVATQSSNVISIHGYQLHVHDGEPMVQDLDLAERLGYAQFRDLRKLIKRMIDNGSIKKESVCATVSQTPGGGRPSTVYYLSEKAVLKVITKSETEKADQITDEMIDVFVSYRNGTLQQKPKQPSRKDLALMVLQAEEEVEALRIENRTKDARIEKLENFFRQGTGITAFGKMLNGVNCQQLNNFCCEELNWLYNESRSGNTKRWRARSNARDKYLTETEVEIGVHGSDPFIKHEPKLLMAGAQKLFQLYLAGKLPMKKTWNGKLTHLKFSQEIAA